MKKPMSPEKKARRGTGLTFRKDSYSSTITRIGEPSARVTIHIGDIEGLEYDTDWKSHSLVTLHGCTLEGAELAVRSAYVASKKTLASPLFDETINNCEDYAIRRFWREGGRSIPERFHDFAEDIKELEGAKNWRRELTAFTRRLYQAHRSDEREKTTPERVDDWLLANWDTGKVACIVNNRQITEMLASDGIEHPEKKVEERIRDLGLKKAKTILREKGYNAHSS